MTVRATLSGIVALVAGCTFAPREQADPRSEIEATVEAFFAAYQAGQVDSVVSFFTSDASLMPPGAPTVRGRTALSAHVEEGMAMGRWAQTVQTEALTVLGASAVHLGTYRLRFEPTESTPDGLSPFEDSGRFLIHWRRSEGRWRMAQYMANRSGG